MKYLKPIRVVIRIAIIWIAFLPLLFAFLKYTGGHIREYEERAYTATEVRAIARSERRRAVEVSAIEFNRSFLLKISLPLLTLIVLEWCITHQISTRSPQPNK